MRLLLLLCLLTLTAALTGQTPPPAKKEPPPVVLLVPQLGVDPGKTSKLLVRGLRLDGVTELQVQEPRVTGKLLGKGKKAGVPNNADVNRLGDSEIEIELTLPAELPGRSVPFALVGPGGESKPYAVLLNREQPRTPEKEPNDAFKQAQPVTLPVLLEGKVERGHDVDTFKLELKAGSTLDAAVTATAQGSPLEAMLTLYDARFQIVATAVARHAGEDPHLRHRVERDGTYYLSLIDLSDQGGPTFVYRLELHP